MSPLRTYHLQVGRVFLAVSVHDFEKPGFPLPGWAPDGVELESPSRIAIYKENLKVTSGVYFHSSSQSNCCEVFCSSRTLDSHVYPNHLETR